jgi:hypothetical protein
LQQRLRVGGAGLEQHTGQTDAANEIGHLDARLTVTRNQRGEAQAEYDRIVLRNDDGTGQVVNAW